MAAYLSQADLRERETRRMVIAKAEVETRLAERELATWHRGRSGSRSSHSSQADSTPLAGSMLLSSSTHRLLDRSPISQSIYTPKSTSKSTFHYVPRQDLDKVLLEKNSEVRQRLESQQEELTAAFTRKLEDTKSHYQSRIAYLESQLNSRNGSHISQVKTALLRREYGEEADDKREQLTKALGRVGDLEEQLAAKTQEITVLRQQTDSLQEKAASDEAQIRKQNDIITSLKSQLETTPRDDPQMRALEQENALLKRDYDALASLHKRTLQERRKPETPGSGRSSPLRRRPEELEEASSLRQYYERRCAELRDEAMQWKEKVKALTLRHHHALQDLQQDKRELQQEIAALGEEMKQQVRAVELELHRQNGFTPRGASLQARRGEIRH